MGFENVEAHDVPDGIVENKTKEVEFDDRMEPASKVVEQRGEIALLGDGLADFEQGFKLTPGVFERGGNATSGGEITGSAIEGRIAPGLAKAQPEAGRYRRYGLTALTTLAHRINLGGSGNETAQTNYYRE